MSERIRLDASPEPPAPLVWRYDRLAPALAEEVAAARERAVLAPGRLPRSGAHTVREAEHWRRDLEEPEAALERAILEERAPAR